MKKVKKRFEMNPKYKLDLSELYTSDKEWQMDYEKVSNELDAFSKYAGNLSSNGEELLNVLKVQDNLQKTIQHLYLYAKLKHYQDMQDTDNKILSGKADDIYTKANTAISFVDPEVLAIGEEKVKDFMFSTEELKIYKAYFDNLFRKEKHMLSEREEKILAMSSSMAKIPRNLFNILNNIDVKIDTVQDSKGNEVEVTHGNYTKLLESKDRVLRENVYNTYYKFYVSHKNTFAGMYSSSIKKESFFSEVRGYNSSLEASLHEDNIPISVYTSLIETVNKGIALSHRCTSIRKKNLGLDSLKPFDLFVPMVENIEYKIDYEQAKDLILKSLEPMGEEYLSIAKNILDSNWIDVYENENKISGAFSWGAYGTPPYIMMNYVDNLNSLFTLTHELGHSIHSHYSRTCQPFVYSDYTIFLAEVASTTHEAMLIEYMLKTTTDINMKKYLLNYQIKNFISTFFRQTMFAEFELQAHQLEKDKKVINVEDLTSIYENLLKNYFGKDLEIDNNLIHEWARIPHFYRSFYVFQYATGFASAMAISKNILDNGQKAIENFVSMLKGGCSDYPIPLLQQGGVDMTTSKPIEETLEVFENLLNEFEKL